MVLSAITWNVDPILFSVLGVEVRYYGLFWALAFGVSLWIFSKIIKREGMPEKVLDSAFWHITIATIVGARLGHCLFYDPVFYLSNPISMLNIREGGMASHGAAIGILVGAYLFTRKNRLPFMWMLDRLAIAVTISGALIRLGNLMNSEIYGDPTTLPWGFIFARNGDTFASHPTQIYEALAYLAIFALMMYLYYKRGTAQKKPGIMFGWFIILLFAARFFIEFIKTPQEDWESSMVLLMGQILSIPFILLGAWVLERGYKHKLPKIFTWVNPAKPKVKNTKK